MSINQPQIPKAEFRKTDNSQAFNSHFLEIDLEKDPQEPVPSRVDFVVGDITKPIYNPSFPVYVDFSEEESAKLGNINVGYLVAYDSTGKRRTCKGCIKFTIENGVVKQC